ncbi:UNKNOWN [Stylonychia lemnae]|uniref:Kinesin motor domain-containing protein n=1 Tax=Stylonychia lemnae TaxID=5949 RepID=A0A078A9A8_STYLE|nr:UNKNOWN [Stylonychia lemnae]|eukprot:CDW78814.1 UNKNOWN [Stylonychia lemnae]
MSKKQSKGIEVYLRIRPSKKSYPGLILDKEGNEVQFNFPKDGQKSGNQNAKDDVYNFVFNGVLDQMTQQETVIESCFEGYNGTIFAYGQTGSGKTYTITGGAERYNDRGIIPRTISYIFNEISKRNTSSYKLNVSYLEIYNDSGYDLLDENHATKSLFDLPKVKIYELSEDQYVLKNLSVHRAENEEDALNLLFIGDTNRVVSETPKNDASTRSHCIFMIQLECQKNGEDVKTVSKLHLVDLSGSERPSQTGIDGKTLEEAKNINLSLHYLAQVIECLNEKARGNHVTHIPYRNSMMTQILRDSLGGNCKTKMIATMISRNEQVDPGVIISRLKKEVQELKAEIALLKGEDVKENLTSEDIERCNKMVQEFIDSSDPSSTIVLADRLMINQCFYHFKHIFRDMQKKKGGAGPAGFSSAPEKTSGGGPVKDDSMEVKKSQEEIQRLQILVQQRDNEIGILLNYLNKKKGDETIPGIGVQRQEESKGGQTLFQMMQNSNQDSNKKNLEVVQGGVNDNPIQKRQNQQDREMYEVQQMTNGHIHLTNEDLADRSKAFDLFRRSYRKNEAMDENRELLKQKYSRGKELGNMVNESRDQIKVLTNKIEQIRKENAMRGQVDSNGEIIQTPEELNMQQKISILKKSYQDQYQELKELKSEIERITNLLERSRQQMQNDFEKWLSVMLKQNQMANTSSINSGGINSTLNTSTGGGFNPASTDKKVNENLEAFYRARNEIYK